MDADTILKISDTQPERLFPNSLDEAKKLYQKLLHEWHPDHNRHPQAQKITDRIVTLYRAVVTKIENKTWSLPNVLTLQGKDKKERIVRYRKKRTFELGEMYYSDRVVCYVTKPGNKDLFNKAIETIKSLPYKNKKMQEEVSKYLPVILDSFETDKGENVLVLSKTPDVYLLQDVIEASGGSIDPKHVAWIMSSFHNIACYLRYAGLTHNGISPFTCFISPKMHSGLLIGGWWYSQKKGEKLLALPRKSHLAASSDMLKSKIADSKLDLSLIRQMGLDCMNDPTGVKILHDGSTPKPMVDFLRGPSSGDAVEDYKDWQEKTLVNSFGKRKFVEMTVSENLIYGE